QVEDATAEQRVGEQAHTVDLDEHGCVADVGDTRHQTANGRRPDENRRAVTLVHMSSGSATGGGGLMINKGAVLAGLAVAFSAVAGAAGGAEGGGPATPPPRPPPRAP